ncbi:poly(3-hydroxybutyrate) depolymerase [Pelomonas sp. KK5]|uniref:extracellular catalytic domain type 2 short-chain-length polyhydroxyalkanoate depolymerase n=1 Tax=Pelomonas sp. KK5 TaxID=1855730 RepID=UPI001E5F5B08|nr:poly(3-hydroxybutyrate) depolymerase [Pelomonas sp. KK5]
MADVKKAAPRAAALREFPVIAEPGGNSVSGLSSGAFMTAQLHLAHSALFAGAGIVAGGPCRCVESFPGASPIAEDAYVQNALFICMNPLSKRTGPQAATLAQIARHSAGDGLIDPIGHLARQRLYLFTGSQDQVVDPLVVQATREFYLALGVPEAQLKFVDDVPAGHALLTSNLEDNALGVNAPPYLSRWTGMQSHDILRHIHGVLNPPSTRLSGEILRFDQREFFDPNDEGDSRSSMSAYGYAYVPQAVLEGAPARAIHVALHGCKQGYNYVNLDAGVPDRANEPPYGNRYFTTTGYNEIADSNGFIVLYPQVEGIDDGRTQNPEGCWDWWGYSDPDHPGRPDYWSKNAIQIRAIRAMLERLGAR